VAAPDRASVWLVDLGIAAKIRPALVLGVPPGPQDRVLVTLVPHTTSVQGTAFEVAVSKPFLKPGAFDAQGLATVAQARLQRKLGELQLGERALVAQAVKRWLGFALGVNACNRSRGHVESPTYAGELSKTPAGSVGQKPTPPLCSITMQ
jgi:mRNA interferase MazF